MHAKIVKQILQGLSKSTKFDRLLKDVKVISAENGKACFEMKVEDQHVNSHGTLHGGMTATLVDSLSTFAIATKPPHRLGVSIDLSVSYTRAANIGDLLTIKSDAYKTGKTLAFAKVDIFNQDGKLLSTGNHIKFVGRDT